MSKCIFFYNIYFDKKTLQILLISILGNVILKIPIKLGKINGGYRMNKEEILARSRKENQYGDERTKIIEKEADQNAFLAIEVINAFLIVILFFQKLLTGKAFADYQVFLLAFLIGFIGRFATKYRYTKKKEWLFGLICGILGSLACLMNIVGKGMGWF